ncbi:MAG: hypothetical protein JEZ08_24705 [Clostridiales bacterium]|nr:hypothetical protein [Clostridiales bacterium]
MKREYKVYVNKVLSYISTDYKTKKKIKSDLLETLMTRDEEGMDVNPYDVLGDPLQVAKEFSENLGMSMINAGFEYRSKACIFGIPLMHINLGRNATAKGIVAIGSKSIGIVSIGGISLGVISLGGIGLGVLSFGGIAAGAFAAFGGVACAYEIAFGGVATAKSLAVGGIAVAKDIAIGGSVSASLMGYKQSFIGENIMQAFRLPSEKAQFMTEYYVQFPEFNVLKDTIIKAILKFSL